MAKIFTHYADSVRIWYKDYSNNLVELIKYGQSANVANWRNLPNTNNLQSYLAQCISSIGILKRKIII